MNNSNVEMHILAQIDTKVIEQILNQVQYPVWAQAWHQVSSQVLSGFIDLNEQFANR